MENDEAAYNSELDEDELDMLYSTAYYGDTSRSVGEQLSESSGLVVEPIIEVNTEMPANSSEQLEEEASPVSPEYEPSAKRHSGGSRV